MLSLSALAVNVINVFYDFPEEMFKNTFQSGFLSILYSIGSKPLQIWDKKVRNGHIKRITDQDIQVRLLLAVNINIHHIFPLSHLSWRLWGPIAAPPT